VPTPKPQYLLTSDAALRLGVTDERVRQLVAERRLRVAAVAGERKPIALFNADEVDALAGWRDGSRS